MRIQLFHLIFLVSFKLIHTQWDSRGSSYTPGPGRQVPNQWGHFSQYDSRNRPVGPAVQGWNPYDPSKGFTPDPSRRRLIEDPGDTRCKEAIHQGLEEFVTVNTAYGNCVGTIVYLCDGPNVPERDRPLSPHPDQRPQGSPSTYRPIRHFWKNVTTFLGIPYARPPTRENNLRFKVFESLLVLKSHFSVFQLKSHHKCQLRGEASWLTNINTLVLNMCDTWEETRESQ
jgi:hypothetical protein